MTAPDWLPTVVVLTWKSVRWKTTAVALLVLVVPPLDAGVPAATVVPADAPAGAPAPAFEVVGTVAASPALPPPPPPQATSAAAARATDVRCSAAMRVR